MKINMPVIGSQLMRGFLKSNGTIILQMPWYWIKWRSSSTCSR